MTLYDVIYVSEFVLFNNRVIFVLLFGKTVKLLLSSMTWVEETKDIFNSSFAFAKIQNVVLDIYGMSFVINNGIWLVSLDCLNTSIIDEICNRKCGIRRPDQDCLHARLVFK